MGRPKYKYQDFFNELAAGRAYGILVYPTHHQTSIQNENLGLPLSFHRTKCPKLLSSFLGHYRSFRD